MCVNSMITRKKKTCRRCIKEHEKEIKAHLCKESQWDTKEDNGKGNNYKITAKHRKQSTKCKKKPFPLRKYFKRKLMKLPTGHKAAGWMKKTK